MSDVETLSGKLHFQVANFQRTTHSNIYGIFRNINKKNLEEKKLQQKTFEKSFKKNSLTKYQLKRKKEEVTKRGFHICRKFL